MYKINKPQRSALLWMTGGTLMVIISIMLMNDNSMIDDSKQVKNASNFDVKKINKPKPKRKIEKKQKSKPKKVSTPVPLVDLNSDLSGIEFDLPAFSLGNGADIDQSLIGDTSNVVMTGDTVDVVPVAKVRAPLEYPLRAKAKEIEGFVKLSLLIGQDGMVKQVKVIEASPPGIFDNAAVRSVKRWKFSPAMFNGKPVSTWVNLPVRFELG